MSVFAKGDCTKLFGMLAEGRSQISLVTNKRVNAVFVGLRMDC